jgi:hypothetical protein
MALPTDNLIVLRAIGRRTIKGTQSNSEQLRALKNHD